MLFRSDATAFGRDVMVWSADALFGQPDVTSADAFKPGHSAKQRGFTATRGAKQNANFTSAQAHADLVNSGAYAIRVTNLKASEGQKHATILKRGPRPLAYNLAMTPQRPSLLLAGLSLLALGLALPILVLLSAWFMLDAKGLHLLAEMTGTVLPDYALTSVLLCLGVGLGVVLVGTGCALLVTLFDFQGRRWLEWALLLPMAMPAYVLAYAYTDFFQYSGFFQASLREMFGWQGRLPEVRSLGGAV